MAVTEPDIIDVLRPVEDPELHRSIVSEHCPFGGAAIANPVICAVDRGMVKGMLAALYGETVPLLESSLPMGDSICVTGVSALIR